MSALGQKQTSVHVRIVSSFPPKAELPYLDRAGRVELRSDPPSTPDTIGVVEGKIVSVLRIAAVQTSLWNPFRRPQIPDVIASFKAWSAQALSLRGGNATTRFRAGNRWVSDCMAAHFARAAEQAQTGAARGRAVSPKRERSSSAKPQRGISAGSAANGLDRRAERPDRLPLVRRQ